MRVRWRKRWRCRHISSTSLLVLYTRCIVYDPWMVTGYAMCNGHCVAKDPDRRMDQARGPGTHPVTCIYTLLYIQAPKYIRPGYPLHRWVCAVANDHSLFLKSTTTISMYMCMQVCVCMYACIHVCVCVCVWSYTTRWVGVCACLYLHVYIYVYAYGHTLLDMWRCVRVYVFIHVCVCICLYTTMWVCVCACICACDGGGGDNNIYVHIYDDDVTH